MAAQVKGDKPYNKDDFQRSATFVSHLAQMPWDGFGAGTDAGAPTKAKGEIWKEMDKFKAAQSKFETEAGKTDPATYGPRDPATKPATDYVAFALPAKREDPCEQMRKQMKK